jgi:hypothetical protein
VLLIVIGIFAIATAISICICFYLCCSKKRVVFDKKKKKKDDEEEFSPYKVYSYAGYTELDDEVPQYPPHVTPTSGNRTIRQKPPINKKGMTSANDIKNEKDKLKNIEYINKEQVVMSKNIKL